MTDEKTTSLRRRLLSGSTLRVGNMAVGAAVSLFLMPFIVHRLGDRSYGFWSLAATFVGYYGLLDFALYSAVSQYICSAIGRGDRAGCRGIFNAALRINLLLGVMALLATGVLVFAAPSFLSTSADVPLFREVIAIMGFSVALSFPAKAYGGLLDAELRFDLQCLISFFSLVLRTGLTIWVLLAGGGLLALAWVTLLASLPGMILVIWFARREAPWARVDSSSIERQRVKGLFSYSSYTAVGSMADLLRFQIDPVVISGFLGLAALTHYRIAGGLMRFFLDGVPSAIGTVQPLLSRIHGAGDRKSLERVFFFATKISVSASTFVCFALIFWGRPFILRWMGPGYQDAYWPMVALSLAVFLDVSQNPSISLLYATANHRFYTYVNVAEGIVNLTFSLALVRPLGILGVALGTLIGAFLTRVVAQPFFVCRATGLRFGHYMRFLGGILLRSGSVVGAVIVVSAWGMKPDYFLLVSSAVWATAVCSVGLWFVVLTTSEREHLWAALKGHAERFGVESPSSPLSVMEGSL